MGDAVRSQSMPNQNIIQENLKAEFASPPKTFPHTDENSKIQFWTELIDIPFSLNL